MKKLELHGKVDKGKLYLDLYAQELRERWLNSSQTFNITVTYEKERKPKTQSQLGYIFGAMVATVKQTLDDRGMDVCGAPWTEHQIKSCLYAQYHAKYGGTKTLRDMEQDETSEFIDSCLHWAAGSPWHIVIPLPRTSGVVQDA